MTCDAVGMLVFFFFTILAAGAGPFHLSGLQVSSTLERIQACAQQAAAGVSGEVGEWLTSVFFFGRGGDVQTRV